MWECVLNLIVFGFVIIVEYHSDSSFFLILPVSRKYINRRIQNQTRNGKTKEGKRRKFIRALYPPYTRLKKQKIQREEPLDATPKPFTLPTSWLH